jgi:hypothetical protein
MVADITMISAMVAAAGVLIGVVYYLLDIRHQTRVRQTDLVMRLYNTFGSTEFQKAYQEVLSLEFEDYADFRKRYPASNAEGAAARVTVYAFFEGIGVLVKRKLIGMDLVDDLLSTNILVTWEKMQPLVYG